MCLTTHLWKAKNSKRSDELLNQTVGPENLTRMINEFEKLMEIVPERYEDIDICFRMLGLNDQVNINRSIYFYTYINDRYNHGYYRYHPKSVMSITQTLKNIE